MARSEITHSRVLELFEYDSATGNLLWRIPYSRRIRVGDVAGSVASNGRRYIGIDGQHIMAHRLVWFYHKGEWPQFNVSQENGNYLDTRIENLVEKTPSETAKTDKLRSNNTSGVKGVYWSDEKDAWVAMSYATGRSVFVGMYKKLEDAAEAAANADRGIFPSKDERLARRAKEVSNRHLWKKMIKWSNGLHEWKSIDDFIRDVGSQPHVKSRLARVISDRLLGPDNFQWTAPDADHRSELAKRKAKEREENRDRYRHGHLMRKFKLSHAEYAAKLMEQKGVCAICDNPETTFDRRGRLRELSVDHDHKTGKVRSLLCFACNVALGSFREDPNIMRAAAEYLDRWNKVEEKSKEDDNVVSFKPA